MQTDIPLKRLTLLCAADLLPLFGLPYAELVAVETLELPASAARLDNVLRVRSPGGQEYLHVVEWQGYRDPAMLWRLASYMAWLGQREPGTTIVGSVVYLTPECDIGDTLTQAIDGQAVHTWQIACVRLWEQEAPSILAAGSPGLAVLSPLMHNADAALIEQAATLVIQRAPQPQQADLLSILGVFAERIMTIERFAQFVGKERLMESRFLDYLVAEKTAAIRAEAHAEGEREQAREYILDTLVTRLNPSVQDYRRVERALAAIEDLQRLDAIFRHALLATDFASFEGVAFPPPAA